MKVYTVYNMSIVFKNNLYKNNVISNYDYQH